MSKKNTSKKVNTKAVVEETTTITGEELRTVLGQYTNISLRRLADATGACYQILLKASKKPIAGELYDPEATNYEEVAKCLARKGVSLEDLDLEALNVAPTRRTSANSKNFADYTVGMKIYLRDHNDVPYEVVYKTDTHIVLMLEGTTEPRLLSESTFFFKGPSLTARTVKAEA